ncbi:hypothetical protein [Bradyrhizobium sp. Ai1a-2]|uniref:hypothetical protein n=1 Tax=Bradyrhizobium sp. Ai1a-2 TaxID=196490 RepID=UPI00047FFF96
MLPMPARRVYCNPLLRRVVGKVAIQRGPRTYRLEEADNGTELHNLWLPEQSRFRFIEGKGVFADKILPQAGKYRLAAHAEEAALYLYDKVPGERRPQRLTFISMVQLGQPRRRRNADLD